MVKQKTYSRSTKKNLSLILLVVICLGLGAFIPSVIQRIGAQSVSVICIKKNGQVRVLNPGDTCRSDETSLTLNAANAGVLTNSAPFFCSNNGTCDMSEWGSDQRFANKNYTDAYVSYGLFNNTDFHSSNWTNAFFGGKTKFGTGNFSSVNFTGADFASGGQADFSSTNLSNANFTNANARNATGMSSANISGVTWSNTTCPDGTNSDSNGNTCVGHF